MKQRYAALAVLFCLPSVFPGNKYFTDFGQFYDNSFPAFPYIRSVRKKEERSEK